MFLPAIIGMGLWVLAAKRARSANPVQDDEEWQVEIGPAVIDEGPDPRLVNMIALAEADLDWWSGHSDEDESGKERVAEYWDFNGRAMSDDPWSGAWMTWLAGGVVPDSLVRVPGHAAYAKSGLTNTSSNKFGTLPGNTPVQFGDIIIKPREGGEQTFEDLKGEFFPSHGDIVSEVNDGYVVAIGGNKLGHKVNSERYPLNPDGSISGLIAVMRLGAHGAGLGQA